VPLVPPDCITIAEGRDLYSRGDPALKDRFNAALRTGELQVLVRDKATGERLRVVPSELDELLSAAASGEGAIASARLWPGGITYGAIDQIESRRDMLNSMFIERAALDAWAKPEASKVRGYAEADAALVAEARALVERERISDWAAAERVAARAKGGGSLDSKVRRIFNRMRSENS
jgi:hypothetical protein